MTLDLIQMSADWFRCRSSDVGRRPDDATRAMVDRLDWEAVKDELRLSLLLGHEVLRARREARRGAPAPTHAQLRALDDAWLGGFGITRLK